jgi:hypothetical protein
LSASPFSESFNQLFLFPPSFLSSIGRPLDSPLVSRISVSPSLSASRTRASGLVLVTTEERPRDEVTSWNPDGPSFRKTLIRPLLSSAVPTNTRSIHPSLS